MCHHHLLQAEFLSKKSRTEKKKKIEPVMVPKLVPKVKLVEVKDADVGGWSPDALKAKANEAFDLFDVDGNGSISVSELASITRRNKIAGKKPNLFQEMKVFSVFDTDGNSIITRKEFTETLATCTDPAVLHFLGINASQAEIIKATEGN